MTKRLELISYEERLRAGTVQPGQEKGQGDHIKVQKYLMGGSEAERAQ